MLNFQAIEKRVDRPDGRLDVHSIFLTIQGEGPFSGTRAVFVRLAGCNLQCPGCDTEYTKGRTFMSPKAILNCVQAELPTRWDEKQLVVITGGEPFRQKLDGLLDRLLTHGYYVQIETNGTISPGLLQFSQDPSMRSGAYMVCSPKTGKVAPGIDMKACAYKYVVAADSIRSEDGLPLTALGHTANPFVARPSNWFNQRGRIYVQPMDSQDAETNRRNLAAATASCLKFGYTLQVQLHKIAGIE